MRHQRNDKPSGIGENRSPNAGNDAPPGPDDRGVYREKGCTLLHGRLAIIDPEGGRQPMTLAWAGEEYTLVYNGELYNTEQLRGELSVLGHSFLGHSDTEVLLHAYAQFGAKCVES